MQKLYEQLDKIISLLEQVLEVNNMTHEVASSDPNPWPYKLISEMNNMSDTDGNGIVYGRDFVFAENLENYPPVLQSVAVTLNETRVPATAQRLTWEEYVATLPPGDFRDRVSTFVESLESRIR